MTLPTIYLTSLLTPPAMLTLLSLLMTSTLTGLLGMWG